MGMFILGINRWQRFQAAVLRWASTPVSTTQLTRVDLQSGMVDKQCRVTAHTHSHPHNQNIKSNKLNLPQRPQILRVVRYLDHDEYAGMAGRMRISGRMSDVCAELDRLVACEAA